MRAVRFTIVYIIVIVGAMYFAPKFWSNVQPIYILFGAIGISALIGIAELIDIFDGIRKNTESTSDAEAK